MNNELIKRDPPTAHVRSKVDRLVEVKDSVHLEVINMPKGALPFIEHALPVTLAIPESFMDQFKKDSVRAVIDLDGFVKGVKKVLPEIKGLPPYSARIESGFRVR